MIRAGMLLLGLMAGTAVWAAQQSPLELVKETTDEMVAALNQEHDAIAADQGRLFQLVEKIVLPHFDFERMSRTVLGKYWRRASDSEKEAFSREFRILLMRTYATAMLEYSGQEIDYLPFRAAPTDDEVIVSTEVQQDAGFPVPVDYYLYRDGDRWKVYGMSIDGVNLVVNYRASFATTIRQEGSVDKLIAKLHQRNQQALE